MKRSSAKILPWKKAGQVIRQDLSNLGLASTAFADGAAPAEKLFDSDAVAPKKPKKSARSVRHIAMDYLARREHSRFELLKKLQAKGIATMACETVLDSLADDGLQSDARFSGAFVRSRIGRGYGPIRIVNDLKQRGVSAELIDVALLDADANWQAQAQAVWEKKFGHAPIDEKQRAKQQRFMQSRGFGYEHIASLLS